MEIYGEPEEPPWVQLAAAGLSAYGASQKKASGAGAPLAPVNSGHVNVGGFTVPDYPFDKQQQGGVINVAGQDITNGVITGVVTALLIAIILKKR